MDQIEGERSSQLAYFLIYVPANKFNGSSQGIPTWEQDGELEAGSPTSSKYGATLIPVEGLLDRYNDWRQSPPVALVRDGEFCPSGLSLGRLLLEMLICQRGEWLPRWVFPEDGSGPLPHQSDGQPIHYTPYREISIDLENTDEIEWEEYVSLLRAALQTLE